MFLPRAGSSTIVRSVLRLPLPAFPAGFIASPLEVDAIALVDLEVDGMKSFTLGYTCTMLPRRPRTFRLWMRELWHW